MKKITITLALTLVALVGLAQQKQQLPKKITIPDYLYVRMDSLIQVSKDKVLKSKIPSDEAQQIASDISFTSNVIRQQITQLLTDTTKRRK